MRAMLDNPQSLEVPNDPNDYAVGFVPALDGSGQHAVILTLQKKPANNSAVASASHLLRSFPTVEYVLMVGIAGGMPDPQHPDEHVRLGDIVVSNPYGVVQYDNVKLAQGKVEIRDSSSPPSPSLIGKANMLEADRLTGSYPWEHYISRVQQVLPSSARPDESKDRLYSSKYPTRILGHPDDPNRRAGQPRVHFGRIGSANTLLKDPGFRDALGEQWHVRAIEMEGSGIADGTWTASQGYFVVRGICDYCDSHKNNTWQAYAAAAAAAYARSLIELFSAPVDPLKEEALEAARKKLDEAEEHGLNYEFQTAAKICEEACRLASSGGEFGLESRAHLQAARSWAQHLFHSSSKEREGKNVQELIHGHINAAESLRAKPGRVAVERLLLARLVDKPEKILQLAAEADRLADPDDISDRVEALCGRMEALLRLGRKRQMLALRGEVERMRTVVVGDQRLALEATWLGLLLHAGEVSDRDFRTFVDELESLVEKGLIPRKLAVITFGDLASKFNQAGRLEDTLTLCITAYQIAEPLADSSMSSTISIQVAELNALSGNEQAARLYLGRADSFCEKHKPVSGATEESWATLRASTLFGRGRTLARLADRLENERCSREKALIEAYEVLDSARKFGEQKRAQLKGNVDVYLADISFWFARVAEHLGRFDDAAKCFQRVRTDSAMAHSEFSFNVGMEAWLREAEALRLAGYPEKASEAVKHLLSENSDSERPDAISARAHAFNEYLDNRELPTIQWLQSSQAREIAGLVREKSLPKAVAAQVAPLVSWWEDWHGGGIGPESELVDVWGRGGFLRVAAAIRTRPHGAIAVDAWSIDEIRKWARIFCPIFETVIVKWKGRLGSGMVLAPLPVDEVITGGHGYIWTSTKVRERWAVATGWANPLPREVAHFLSTEALGLFRAGRLIILPAPLVGCTQSAVAWTDDLLVNNFLSGIVAVARKDLSSGEQKRAPQRVLDLDAITVPFIDGIGLAELATVLDETSEWVRPLQRSLKKSLMSDDLKWENVGKIEAMEDELEDASRYLREHLEEISQKRETWRVASAPGTVSAVARSTLSPGHEPMTDLLRSLAPMPQNVAPWVPYWRLESLGGYLDWTRPIDNPSKPDPEEPEIQPDRHSWLYPGTPGVGWMPVIVPAQ